MTKSFLHGRTEAIRTVQPHSVEFVKVRHPLEIYNFTLKLVNSRPSSPNPPPTRKSQLFAEHANNMSSSSKNVVKVSVKIATSMLSTVSSNANVKVILTGTGLSTGMATATATESLKADPPLHLQVVPTDAITNQFSLPFLLILAGQPWALQFCLRQIVETPH